jgi:dephospho-CoA kinase
VLVIEVSGGPRRLGVAEQRRGLASAVSMQLEVVTAEVPTHVAAIVVATDQDKSVRSGQPVDVVVGGSPAEVSELWRSRLEPLARTLASGRTPRAQVRLVDPDSAWATLAQVKIARLRRALVDLDDGYDYQHIGSTAVPGLMAKPIIDLQIRVPTLPEAGSLGRVLEPVGFMPATGARPDSPGVFQDDQRGRQIVEPARLRKHLYVCPDPGARTILHIRRLDSPFARHALLLRDRLRRSSDDRAAYQRLKVALAAKHADDPDYDNYTRGKSSFIAGLAHKIDDCRGVASADAGP